MPKNFNKTNFSDAQKGLNAPGTIHVLIDVGTTVNYDRGEAPRYYRVNITGVATITDQRDTAIAYNCEAVGELIRFSDAKTVDTDGDCQLIATW